MTTADSTTDEWVSPPARLAEPDEDISVDELRLAARNHAMHLEGLSYDVTPVGMHYLLIHYDIPYVDAAGWRLRIGGHVAHPLEVSLDDLRSRPRVTRRVTLECAGNGRVGLHPRPVSQPWVDGAVSTAEWTGTPLAGLLREAVVLGGAVDVGFTGADHGIERGEEHDFRRGLPLAEAERDDVLLAYEMNGQALPPQHGAPVRLIVPGWYGVAHVKWLVDVTVLDHAFEGYHNDRAYRVQHDADDVGEPVTRILPRALMRPPGFPDYQTRTRVVDHGRHELTGRAWSGRSPVIRVEVSVDDGRTWAEAELDAPPSPYAWQVWRYVWDATAPGRHDLLVRASDGEGVQPVAPVWNRQGVANNYAQRVVVYVR